MAERVCVTWVEDFCPEAQTRGLRPCLPLPVFGPNRIILPERYLLIYLLQVVFVLKRDAGGGLEAYLPSDLFGLHQNPQGKRWLLPSGLLGDQWSGDDVAADNNLCSSNFQHL